MLRRCPIPPGPAPPLRNSSVIAFYDTNREILFITINARYFIYDTPDYVFKEIFKTRLHGITNRLTQMMSEASSNDKKIIDNFTTNFVREE